VLFAAALLAARVVSAQPEGGAAAQAEGGTRIPINVLVTHLSNEGLGVDPPARFLDSKLKEQFRYDSLKVIQTQRLELALDEVGQVDLPNGKAVRMRPIHKGEDGVLMAVDVEGAAQLDVRVKSRHPVVIRAGPYEEGSLVLSLELDY
jgi:hypothetical protein